MDLVKLQRMVAIYEAGSFRQAARELNLSQPALTWSIRQLEESLDGVLFERGPRGIRPTELCTRLVRRARLIFREQERILDEVETSARAQTINVGVHSILLTPAFAKCLAEFSLKWPHAKVRVLEGYSAELVKRVQQGEVDFACCVLPCESEHNGTLATEPFGALSYSVMAEANHPVFDDIAAGRPIGQYNWVDYDTAALGAFPGDKDVVSIMASAGRQDGRKSVSSASMDVIRLLIAEGGFIGLIADQMVMKELENGTLRRLPGTGVSTSRFGFVSIADSFETSACRELRELLNQFAFGPAQQTSEVIPTVDS